MNSWLMVKISRMRKVSHKELRKDFWQSGKARVASAQEKNLVVKNKNNFSRA